GIRVLIVTGVQTCALPIFAAVTAVLADPAADPAEFCGATLVAGGVPDLAFVPPLLVRLEAALTGAGHAPDCVAALERIAGRHYEIGRASCRERDEKRARHR